MADKYLHQSGVYCIRNIISGYVYIGSSVAIMTRWSLHRHRLKKNKHHSERLQASWNRDGASFFIIEILESVSDESRLVDREQFWIDKLNSAHPSSGFNIHPNAASALGSKLTESARAKISRGQMGRVFSDETKAKISAARKGQTMKPQTPEHCAKISAANKGRKLSAETRERMSKAKLEWYSKRALAHT